MREDRSSETLLQVIFVVVLFLLIGFSIFLFLNSQNNTTNNSLGVVPTTTGGTTTGTTDVSVADRSCTADSQCGAGEYCNNETSRCVSKKNPGQNCNRDQQCLNSKCVNNVCTATQSCNDDNDCPTGQFCGTGQCRDPRVNGDNCSRDRQCASGYCDGSTCRTAPTTNTNGGDDVPVAGGGNLPDTALGDDVSSIIIVASFILLFVGISLYIPKLKSQNSDQLELLSSSRKIYRENQIRKEFEEKFE